MELAIRSYDLMFEVTELSFGVTVAIVSPISAQKLQRLCRFSVGLLKARGCEDQWPDPRVCHSVATGLPSRCGVGGLIGEAVVSGKLRGPRESFGLLIVP